MSLNTRWPPRSPRWERLPFLHPQADLWVLRKFSSTWRGYLPLPPANEGSLCQRKPMSQTQLRLRSALQADRAPPQIIRVKGEAPPLPGLSSPRQPSTHACTRRRKCTHTVCRVQERNCEHLKFTARPERRLQPSPRRLCVTGMTGWASLSRVGSPSPAPPRNAGMHPRLSAPLCSHHAPNQATAFQGLSSWC